MLQVSFSTHHGLGVTLCSFFRIVRLPDPIDHDSLLQELESPEDDTSPQLFFAGDYVTKHPGSVHSEYQSGINAVRRAIAVRKTG
jgi:hypothetical protein